MTCVALVGSELWNPNGSQQQIADS
jgi:hypothetical protein